MLVEVLSGSIVSVEDSVEAIPIPNSQQSGMEIKDRITIGAPYLFQYYILPSLDVKSVPD